MAQDPRQFTVNRACAPAKDVLSATNKKDTFSLLGKVGDLEVLNDSGGNIGQGLRTLGSISESVRNRSGVVPDVFRAVSGAVDAGADTVLATVGFNPRNVRDNVAKFSPQVANRAVGQAESIYDSVRNGQFDQFEDLPNAIQDFTNLEVLTRNIISGPPTRVDKFKDQCVSPYAMDLVSRAPKHKFMFVLEIILKDPFVSRFNAIKPNLAEELAFVVKRAGRPTVSLDYEEVNYYNFRTKILKRHEYQPVTMTFYDDHNGNAISFWNNYLRSVSPLSEFKEATEAVNTSILEANGMNFEPGVDLSGNFPSSSGTSSLLANSNGVSPVSVIDHINLYHFYKAGTAYDVYTYANPKITELTLDELDMTQTGDGCEVAFTFNYDALFMATALETTQEVANSIADLTSAGEHELRPPVTKPSSPPGITPSVEVNAPPPNINEALTEQIDNAFAAKLPPLPFG